MDIFGRANIHAAGGLCADQHSGLARGQGVLLRGAWALEFPIREAEASATLGNAKAGVKKVEADAKSELFKLVLDAFGSDSAYN